jgi:hypothetical protein
LREASSRVGSRRNERTRLLCLGHVDVDVHDHHRFDRHVRVRDAMACPVLAVEMRVKMSAAKV